MLSLFTEPDTHALHCVDLSCIVYFLFREFFKL